MLDPDSLKLVYKTGVKVNGPYGAGISFSEVDLKTKKVTLLRQPAIKYRLYELMGEPYLVDKKLAYTVYSPADSGKGMANEYLHLLLSGKDTLQNFGIRRFTHLNYKMAFKDNKELLFLEDEQFLPEDTNYIATFKNNELLYKTPLPYQYVKGYLSPGGRYMLYITATQEAFSKYLVCSR